MGNTLCVEETISTRSGRGTSRMSKIERYGWILRDSPGVFMEIDKSEIQVDHEYQRDEVNVDKVRLIASSWSWAGCGAINVALRPDGRFFVFDGQHRFLAAKIRADITTLPCMVFECDSVAKEAAGFLVTNSERKPVTAIDKFRSLVITEDDAANHVKQVLHDLGIEISKTANRPGQIKCVARCMTLATSDLETFNKAASLSERVCRDVAQIHEDIVTGLFHIHRKHRLLDDMRFVRRVLDVGHASLIDGIRRSRLFRGKGGELTLVEGILTAANKGLRNRFGEKSAEDEV
jgi:hypothetical protein